MALNEALLSLAGLSLGDAFGQSYFLPDAQRLIERRELLPGPWKWGGDTQLAISVVEELEKREWIDQDYLARRMAWRYLIDPARGYSPSTHQTLERIAQGEYFRSVSKAVFNGGSYGSAASPRAVPLGAFFSGQTPAKAAREARLATAITHLHPEALAGAEAVAAAASLAGSGQYPQGAEFLQAVVQYVSESRVRQRLVQAAQIPGSDLPQAAALLGTGESRTVFETVPFALWSAAHHLDNYEEALWWTVSGLGDRDTNCAIVGGIVALTGRNLPIEWIRRCEPLPQLSDLALAPPTETARPFAQVSTPELFSRPGVGDVRRDRGPETSSIQVDPLTGLPNLLALLRALEKTQETEYFASFHMIAIHLQGLAGVNRTQGRTAGDELLRALIRAIRNHSEEPLYRASGDKFVLWLPGSEPEEIRHQVTLLAETVERRVNHPVRLAVLHFDQKLLATPGNFLACFSLVTTEQHYRVQDGRIPELDAGYGKTAEDFPWMVWDLANQMLQLGRMADESDRLAHTDSISQLPNMRAALSALETIASQARSRHLPMAVLMVDGDNLRNYNRISIEAGDEAIRSIGSTLRGQLRDTDFLARWRTGDEFLVLLPDTDRDQTLEIGHRLCQAVERASLDWPLRTTISIGVAFYPEHGPTVQELLRVAENGLESAKQAGKNMVFVGS